MRLNDQELESIYYGAYSFAKTADGYLQAFQYTAGQMKYFESVNEFWFERCSASTAKTLELVTDATEISFGYKLVWKGSEDTFELFENGLASTIVPLNTIEDEGVLHFTLSEGKKSVIIYLPSDATALIRDFELNGAYMPASKNEKVLWLGDSITQGFGPFRSAHTYVSVANRILNYDIINQGIGAYIYDKNVLVPMEGYKPDKIIVALGTNQYGDETMDAVEEYYARLNEIYGNTPVLCITPIWRGDSADGLPVLCRYRDGIARVCAKYDSITVIDGFTLVPHLPEYFVDRLHPNALGAELYGRNLAAQILAMKL